MSDRETTTSARALRELTSSRRPNSNPSPPRSLASADDLTNSTFDPEDALMSTKQNIYDDDNDSRVLQKIRTTAMNRRYYNPEPQPHVASSAVRREFQDFDHSNSTDDSDISIEIGRGIGHTPSKPNKSLDSDILLDLGNSIFETKGTPPSRTKAAARQSNLRKEAVLRRTTSTRVQPTKSYSNMSLRENNPPGDDYGFHTRTTRFGSRTVSADNDTYQRPLAGTPQRGNGTPRGMANSTAQSFLLPEIPNITELIGGSYKDGTPVWSVNGRAKTRIASLNVGRRPDQPNFIPIGGIPIPEEEKAILASLQIMKDRVAQLEQEKADADRRAEEYELEVSDLRHQLDAQADVRRSDSALGSTDGEGPAHQKMKWKIENAQLESSVQSLQRRVDQADRKISVAEIATKRVTQERDSLATQLGVAFYNAEEIKSENEILKNENRLLQDQVTDLQTENRELIAEIEQLRSQADHSHERHEEENHRWGKKEAALQRKADTNDRAILQENQTLRDELVRAREQQEEIEHQAVRREEKARRQAERVAQTEHAKLSEENENLKSELGQAKATREAELKRWAGKQAELQTHIDQREETIHHLQGAVPQEQINDELRQENQDLKAQLARVNAETKDEEQGTPKDVLRKRLEEVTYQHVNEATKWTQKESRLRDRLEQAKEVNNLHRQLDAIRDERPLRSTSEPKTKRRSTGQSGRSTQDEEFEQVQKTRSRSKSHTRRVARPDVRRGFRHASAPVKSVACEDGDFSDASTTDLSFDPAILAGAPRAGGKGKRATGFTPAQTGDTTYLSMIEGDEIETLRRRLEEERIALRREKELNARLTEEARGVTGYGTRRRNSQKDLTARSRASSRAHSVISRADSDSELELAEAGARKEDTMRSNFSRTSRASRTRRRSSNAFTEMTSAFILPDITLHARKDATAQDILRAMSSSSAHDSKSCAVCQRILSNPPLDTDDIEVPAPVPVTTRPEFQADIDATTRPSQPPAAALSRVIKDLNDELHHLRLEFAVLTTRLSTADPALSKRARTAVHEQLEKLNRAIQSKMDQLYALYDVCEAHKVELERLGEGEGIGAEVEKTLGSIRVERAKMVEEARAGAAEKKVGFRRSSKAAVMESEDEESDEVWSGISDTEGM